MILLKQKINRILNDTLPIVGILGVLSLLLTYFTQKHETLLIFGQILLIISLSSVSFFAWMLFLKGCGRTIPVLLVMMGAIGLVIDFVSQLINNELFCIEPTVHIAGTFLSLGVLILLNNSSNVKNFRNKI